jgi:hypothetical protein
VRIMPGWPRHRRPQEKVAAQGGSGAEPDELTAELTASYWRARDQRLAQTSFGRPRRLGRVRPAGIPVQPVRRHRHCHLTWQIENRPGLAPGWHRKRLGQASLTAARTTSAETIASLRRSFLACALSCA